MKQYSTFTIYGTVANLPRQLKDWQGNPMQAESFDLTVGEGQKQQVFPVEIWSDELRQQARGLHEGMTVAVTGGLRGRRFKSKAGKWCSEVTLSAYSITAELGQHAAGSRSQGCQQSGGYGGGGGSYGGQQQGGGYGGGSGGYGSQQGGGYGQRQQQEEKDDIPF